MAEAEPENIDEVIESLEDYAEHHSRVCIADVLDEFGHRSYGPFLVLLPLIELSPLGAVPGVPTLLAFLVATIAVQLVLHRDHIWLPQFVQQRAVRGRKLASALSRVEGIGHFLSRCCAGRLDRLAHGLPVRIAGVCILLLCLAVPPLELLPFASSVPMIAIAAFGLAITVRDGLLMVIAAALTLAAFGFGGWMIATQEFAVPFA